jgi:hypothetical protein
MADASYALWLAAQEAADRMTELSAQVDSEAPLDARARAFAPGGR